MTVSGLREEAMITVPELAAEALGSYLAEYLGRRFGSTDADLIELIQSAARLAVDCCQRHFESDPGLSISAL